MRRPDDRRIARLDVRDEELARIDKLGKTMGGLARLHVVKLLLALAESRPDLLREQLLRPTALRNEP